MSQNTPSDSTYHSAPAPMPQSTTRCRKSNGGGQREERSIHGVNHPRLVPTVRTYEGKPLRGGGEGRGQVPRALGEVGGGGSTNSAAIPKGYSVEGSFPHLHHTSWG